VRFLRRRDRRQAICFTDIDAPDFEALSGGPAADDLRARIHARLPDGTWIQGVEVFRRLYGAIGSRRLVALSRLPGISHALDRSYSVFARNRRRVFGRCTSETCRAAPAPKA
jgi:predicted DCC family thiol-disulfide oxidoreductase YuxK